MLVIVIARRFSRVSVIIFLVIVVAFFRRRDDGAFPAPITAEKKEMLDKEKEKKRKLHRQSGMAHNFARTKTMARGTETQPLCLALPKGGPQTKH